MSVSTLVSPSIYSSIHPFIFQSIHSSLFVIVGLCLDNLFYSCWS